jgi:DNA modification methylase
VQGRANCTVLDPFSGIATTGQTANWLGHDYIGIELNQTYADFSDEWIAKEPRWSIRARIRKTKRRHLKSHKRQKSLF